MSDFSLHPRLIKNGISSTMRQLSHIKEFQQGRVWLCDSVLSPTVEQEQHCANCQIITLNLDGWIDDWYRLVVDTCGAQRVANLLGSLHLGIC